MKTIIRNIVILLSCSSMLTSCSMWNNETNGAVLGGIGGAILGGALGEALGGPRGSDVGSTIGATIGTVAGASAGREKDRQEIYEYYNQNRNIGGGYSIPYNKKQSDYSDNYQSESSYYDEESGLTYVRMNNDGDISFSSNSSSLSGNSYNALNTIFRKLSRCNNDIYIYGSADAYERNADALSGNRASAVSQWLMGKGIQRGRIHVVSLGNSNPIGNNNTERGRALNRSVEVFIVK